jgi:hypothetical protein
VQGQSKQIAEEDSSSDNEGDQGEDSYFEDDDNRNMIKMLS